jgi:hypothetical protein
MILKEEHNIQEYEGFINYLLHNFLHSHFTSTGQHVSGISFLVRKEAIATLHILSEEILNTKGEQLEASPQKSLRLLCQETSVPKSSLNAARKFLILDT